MAREGRWTIHPRDLVHATGENGELRMSVPFYKDGELQFTQETRVDPDGKLVVRFLKAEGATTVRGFEAWSDF